MRPVAKKQEQKSSDPKPVNLGDGKRVKATAMAYLFDVSGMAIRQWNKRDGCPRNEDGTYDLKSVIAWRTGRAKANGTGGDDAPRTRRELALAQLAELRVAKEEGRLVSRSEVEAEMLSLLRSAKRMLLQIPKSLGHRLSTVHDPHEIERVISKRITDALNRLGHDD